VTKVHFGVLGPVPHRATRTEPEVWLLLEGKIGRAREGADHMKWMGWVGTGLGVAIASSIAVAVLAGIAMEPPRNSDDGFGQLALLAMTVVSGAASLAVSVVIMPFLITACEGCFQKRLSILIAGGVVGAIALPYWISENFEPGVLVMAAGPFLSAILMAMIANKRASGET
jgi:hypothetical protein